MLAIGGELKMEDKFESTALINVIYFKAEDTSSQSALFESTVEEWREEVGANWNGFDNGDVFLLNETQVRVYKKVRQINTVGKVAKEWYFISERGLKVSDINFDELVEK